MHQQGRNKEARTDGIVLGFVAGGYSGNASQWVFSGIRLQGEKVWRPQRLAWVALLMAWDEGQTLATRWEHAKQAALAWHAGWELGTSYSGFTEALTRSSDTLVTVLKKRLRREMLRIAPQHTHRCRWLALAADGSRFETPHVEANEKELGCAGREKTAPQVFVTTLWHMGTGLPWDFRTGPGTDSERRHLETMIDDLPERSLLVADAGFAGFELCKKIRESGRFFLFRVGSNVTLLTELGYEYEQRDGRVYLWPQKHRHQPPLVLRLIQLTRGKQTVYLLTNVLDPADLTDEEAGVLYEMRWGIEVFYRSCKQTLERRKLLSRTPSTCLAEAQWTLLGIWLLGLLTMSELVPQGIDPLAISFAKARDAVRRAMRRASSSRRTRRGFRSLRQELARATKDQYQRRYPKNARNYPRKKREQPPGPPNIKSATTTERTRAQQLLEQLRPTRRTA